ncbi:MAG TPA: hypothetical protein VLU46_11740 [Thermoanaerobaculia bacterium]|nr:hypothetical protein [Thermoanaerobaculia bacterium]
MNAKALVRIILFVVFVLIVFFAAMNHLQKTLVEVQRERGVTATTSTR